MNVIKSIRKEYSCAVVNKCEEKGCNLRLNNLTNFTILKGEKICTDCKVCDCLIFIGSSCRIVSLVELKSKKPDASEVVEKLTNGSDAALNILKEYTSNGLAWKFYHIMLSKSIGSPSELKVLKRNKIKVVGKKHLIIRGRCKDSLSAIIKKYS